MTRAAFSHLPTPDTRLVYLITLNAIIFGWTCFLNLLAAALHLVEDYRSVVCCGNYRHHAAPQRYASPSTTFLKSCDTAQQLRLWTVVVAPYPTRRMTCLNAADHTPRN